MQKAMTLFWKEWRDQRALVLAFAVLAPLGLWATQVVWLDPGDPMVGRLLLPAICGLFAVVLAAECLTADWVSGSCDALGRLPVRPRALWAAKVALVVGVAPLFAIWLCGAEAARRALFGMDGSVLASEVGREGLPVFLLALVATAAVLPCAVVLRRGFAAVLAAVLIVLGSVALGGREDPGLVGRWVQTVVSARGPWFAVVAASGALACASLAAFSPWLRSKQLARVALALLGFGAVAVPVVALGTASYLERVSVEPGAMVWLHDVVPSPDGRHAAVQVIRDAPWKETTGRGLRALWLIDLETGVTRVLARDASLCAPVYASADSAWTSTGSLVATTGSRVAWIDPDTGVHVREESLQDWPEIAAELAPPSWLEIEKGEADMRGLRTWVLRWKGTGRELRVQSPRRPQATARPGVFLASGADEALVLHEWDAGRSQLVPGHHKYKFFRTSPDGTFAYFQREDGLHVVDTRTGLDALEPGPWGIVGWSAHGTYVGVLRRDRENLFALLDAGGVRYLAVPGDRVHELRLLPGGGFLARRGTIGPGHGRIERLDSEGNTLAVLPDVGTALYNYPSLTIPPRLHDAGAASAR